MKAARVLAFLSIVYPTAAFVGGKTPSKHKARVSPLQAFPYKIGAKTEGVLINNRFIVDSLKKSLPADVEMSEIALLRFALAFPDENEAEAA